MTNQTFARVALAATFIFSASTVMAQHDLGGGSASASGATGGGGTTRRSTTGRRKPRKPATVRKPTAPRRKRVTPEQYKAQGDELFEAKNYDDALDAYTKAVGLKPIASAYYHIGWIYNDRDDYETAIPALQASVRLNPNDAVAFSELGYSYRGLKQYPQALEA